MDKVRISTLREGEEVEGLFVVKIKKAIQPYSKGFRFDLVLGDETGKTLECTYWGGDKEEVERLHQTIQEDSVVKVKGRVDSYKNQLHLSIGEGGYLERVESEEKRFLFVREPQRDIEVMKTELAEYIKKVEDKDLRRLLEEIFKGEFLERFANHAGAIQYHHAWRGGLLQHTLEVAEIGDLLARQHGLNRDFVITGALLHDIGKLEEIEVNVRIKGTLQGSLLGHIVQSVIIVDRACTRLNLPRSKRDKIIHIIVSHHGNLMYGSPKEPMFPEALAVYLADYASSQLNMMKEVIEEAKESTESATVYSKFHRRNLLIKYEDDDNNEIKKEDHNNKTS